MYKGYVDMAQVVLVCQLFRGPREGFMRLYLYNNCLGWKRRAA